MSWPDAYYSNGCSGVCVVKLVVQVKLSPSPAQAVALAATLHACNEAADYASQVAFDRKTFSRNDVQKLVYGELKSRGSGAQAAVRTVKKIVTCKARRAGVPVIEVDARYTSQMCPRCGHTARNNRSTRDHFSCRRCGLAGPADHVAGINVRRRARSAWVFVNMPQLEPSSRFPAMRPGTPHPVTEPDCKPSPSGPGR